VCSPSKRRLLQAVDFASTGSHTVDLMKVNEVVDYRTTITKEKDYVERFVDAWKGGKPSMVACRFQMRKAQKSKVRSHQQHRVRSKSTSD
jgi:hypothetical protein